MRRITPAVTVVAALVIGVAVVVLYGVVDTTVRAVPSLISALDAPAAATEKSGEPEPLEVSVPALDIRRVQATNARWDNRRALRHGFLHVKGSAYPWQRGNVYLAGHDLGFPGTDSWHLLWNLDSLMHRDRILLRTERGTVYVYRVYESEIIDPNETRVLGPNPTPDTPARFVSLQTCVPHFVWDQRLIVRGELVKVVRNADG